MDKIATAPNLLMMPSGGVITAADCNKLDILNRMKNATE